MYGKTMYFHCRSAMIGPIDFGSMTIDARQYWKPLENIKIIGYCLLSLHDGRSHQLPVNSNQCMSVAGIA